MNSSVRSLSRAWLPQRWLRTLFIGLGAAVGAVVLTFLIINGEVRAAVALTCLCTLVALAVLHIPAAIFGAFVYLVLMGDLRRLLIPWAGWSGTDPLLLVGPVFAILLCGYAWASQAVRVNTSMARWVLMLMAVMVLQMFNPRQGGLIVGVAGGLFYLVPLLWYWAGRTYVTPARLKTLLYYIVIPLGVAAALLGYYQTFYGYLPYQMQWYHIAGYTALGAEGEQAPISFFSSSSEYGNFLIMSTVVLWAAVLRKKNYAALVLIALFFVAVFLTGIRGPVAKLFLVAVGLYAVMGRSLKTWLIRGVFALLIGVVGLGWGLSSLEGTGGNQRVQHRTQRQIEGLTGATSEGSSAGNHLDMMLYGYRQGLQQPLGMGLGFTTKAAKKFGSAGGSVEGDSSNMFISTGLVGGVIYLIIIFLILRTALRYWHHTRSLVALALLGILMVTFLDWLKGGQYAVSPLIWICIGALDRFAHVERAPADEARVPVTAR